MNLGFYYHSAAKVVDKKIYVPGYIGVFISELAKQTTTLYLFLQHQPNKNSTEEDYFLEDNNIIFIDLGPKNSFYNRLLAPKKTIEKFATYVGKLDALLLRCPTPLAPNIFNAFYKKTPVFPLLVGNYINGLKDLKQPFIRKLAIKILTYYYQYLQNSMVKRAHIFVNSGLLEEENKTRAKQITLIKTTTLNEQSFFKRDDTCKGEIINLLYTGRINFQKGLRELVEATAELNNKYNIKLHLVGWEDGEKPVFQMHLNEMAADLKITDKVVFHGKQKIGPQLNHFYRTSDIYIIPSYHEGFPRTIWEAMASSLPVVATSVGSIPYYLHNKEDVYIIKPRDKDDIVKAIEELINDNNLRQKIIKNAYELVSDITLEKQTKVLIDKIKTYGKV